ncbi:MAG: M24 family metallopeptidase [Armatimonadota bacterium]|nr:M24 family metallopeptidase [Armatimonadota bacterium]MDR7558640.1 M24 family metallopeptidase [Armatimonadota bacterium]
MVHADAWNQLQGWMAAQGMERLWLYRPENFAWLTGGDSTVVAGEGVAWLEATRDELVMHTSVIEAARLAEEEAPGLRPISYPWHALPPLQYPNDLEHDLTSLRLVLPGRACEQFRTLGRETAMALGEAVREALPGWSERRLAAVIAERLTARGIQPVVLLAAGEDRLFRYRHPLPKDRPLGRLCLAVVCGRRHGLVANVTRMRSWGHPEVAGLYEQVLAVEAAALAATRPGATLAHVLEAVRSAYERLSRAAAFEEHHQGGLAGYRPREIVATPATHVELGHGMAVAWNPSLPGAKVEDTFLITAEGLENLTLDPYWPVVSVAGRERPAVFQG